MKFPSCYWQITDDRRGLCVHAGHFRMGAAVGHAMRMIDGGGWVGSITVEPWFESHAEEFEFWAKWWAMQESEP